MIQQCNSRTLTTSELYDQATGKFTPGASLHQARDLHSVFSLAGGSVIVIGGETNNSPIVASELFTPQRPVLWLDRLVWSGREESGRHFTGIRP